MALVLYDRVQQTGTANTTVSFTLSGSVTGYQSFSVVGNGNTTYYGATDTSGNWESGIGTYATGGTLTRTTILSSSNSSSAVTFSGTVTVFVTYPASKSINYDGSGVATIGSTLGYSDTGIIGSFVSTVAGYNQVIVQNKNTATNASSNFNVSNDAATSTTGYAELGINSSTYTGTGSFSIAGAAYLASASTDLTIGTYGAYNVHFVTNSNTVDAMTIYNSGGVSLGGYADPGIGTLYANNVYIGFNTITAAAGTTVLTNASAGYQQVVGTTTQSIQLPNATTMYKGLAYTIANNSTGVVTIKNSASATLDTTVSGGTSLLVLTDNSTSAGTWVAYSYLPSTYDFSTATANFGNATITNAVWNGTTIGTGYGGTGLTTFAAANNAIYSTSSSALAAGTLPVLAGGTGVTTSTGSGNNVLSTSPTLVTPILGTPTSGNLANCTGLPISTGVSGLGTGVATFLGTPTSANLAAAVTDETGSGSLVFATSPTLVTPALGTPSSATLTNATGLPLSTGVTGTLGIGNGGTGQTTAGAAFNALSPITTAGDLIIGTGVNTAGRLGIGANGYVLTSNGSTASWAAAGGSTTLNITDFTATAGQTSFSVTYTPGLVEGVYRNGSKLGQADYTATSGTAIVLASGATVGDLIQIEYFTSLATTTAVNTISFGSTGLTPSTATSGAVTVAGTLAVGNGGTGATTLTANGVLYGNGTSAVGITAAGTTGQVLTATTSGAPTWAAAAGATITGTTTAGTYYVVGTTSTSGSLTTASISNTNAVSYNASTGALTAVSMVSSSDERLKSNIQTLTNAVQTVENLRGVSYLRNDRPEIGVIAQEVEKILPMLVHEDPEGYKSVAYGNMVGLLIEAVKELSAEVKALKAELNK